MERGEADRGPPELPFPALLRCVAAHIDLITDTRQKAKVNYPLRDCYLSGFAMFYLQDPSLLEFQRRFQLDRHPHEPLGNVYSVLFGRLSDSGVLGRFQFLPDCHLLTLDGSQYFASGRLQCPHCLVKEHKDGRREYSHQILQATVAYPDLRQLIPLAPEFIANEDGHDKQDCEINAAKRLIARLRASGEHVPFIIVGDGLYSKQPFFMDLMQEPQRLHFLLVAKPADHTDLFADVAGLRRRRLLECAERRDGQGRLHRYEWVNDIALNADAKSPSVNFPGVHDIRQRRLEELSQQLGERPPTRSADRGVDHLPSASRVPPRSTLFRVLLQ
ncbi:MAG: hypothetical protein A2177_05795 [Spirochaetes bacterium RBG_13_68_11]|nr:MAG: hypothetical protein A2177_05795 [Spirochaetes bacterium RBG_13_68_11]